jgi:subtilisin family serine protease
MGDVEILELPPGADARDFVSRYQRSGHVAAAHLDHWIEPAALPDDPAVAMGTQWHLNNLGLNGGLVGADIHAAVGWDTLNSASNIIVAVMDSGVRQTHEDLAANLWVNPAETPDGDDNDGNGIVDDIHGINAILDSGNPEDDTGHGTHVCGIIGAVGNNGIGSCGVAWRVQLMACKFLGPTGGSESSLIKCLDYARDKGARIINCSFTAPASAISISLSNAFLSVRNAGIIVVAAAGNSGANIDVQPQFPASFPMDNIIAVTSTTRADGFSGFNYGATTVHLGAPGSDIYSTSFGFDSNYGTMSGTSMAAPCVAGAVALVRARFPGLNYKQVISRVLATVDPLPSLVGRCRTGGRLNLARALGLGDFTPQPAAFSWVPTNGMTSISLTDNGVSSPVALPFVFRYYGRTYSQIYVGANGLLGVTNFGLSSTANLDLPTSAAPNGIVCPYWDDLNPDLGGSVWVGSVGLAPNRKAVVSWVAVPHVVTTGGSLTPLTFQVVLHESGEIAFQYLEVERGRSDLIAGKSASVGVEDETGLAGTRYAFNGSPVLLTNNSAILFSPRDAPTVSPSLRGVAAPQGDQYPLLLAGSPGRTYVVSGSANLADWTPLATNVLSASGLSTLLVPIPDASPQYFFRTEVRP